MKTLARRRMARGHRRLRLDWADALLREWGDRDRTACAWKSCGSRDLCLHSGARIAGSERRVVYLKNVSS
jgi:hypothetical protein